MYKYVHLHATPAKGALSVPGGVAPGTPRGCVESVVLDLDPWTLCFKASTTSVLSQKPEAVQTADIIPTHPSNYHNRNGLVICCSAPLLSALHPNSVCLPPPPPFPSPLWPPKSLQSSRRQRHDSYVTTRDRANYNTCTLSVSLSDCQLQINQSLVARKQRVKGLVKGAVTALM